MSWNREHLAREVGRNPILVTALNPVIGYEKAAVIAKEAMASGRAVLAVAAEHIDLDRAELEKLLDPAKLTGPSATKRSEARRVGKECVSTCRSRRSPRH